MSEHTNQTPQPGQWQPTNPPAPPMKKKGFVQRHPILSVGIGLTVMVITRTLLGGGGDTSSAGTMEHTTAVTSTVVAAAAPTVVPDNLGGFAYASGWSWSSSRS